MADSQFNDAAVLTTDPTFQGRVGSALWAYCAQVIPTEVVGTTPADSYVHIQRKNYAQSVLNNPSVYRPFFINAASVDTTVLSDATLAGTVPLITSNVSVQQALISDQHISNAVAAVFNAFVVGI